MTRIPRFFNWKFTIEEEDFSSRSIDLEIHIEFSVQRDRI